VLNDQQVSIIGLILNTWVGFHKTRRKYNLYISHCYVLLSCVWLDSLCRSITEGGVRNSLSMFKNKEIHYFFTYLISKGYIVLTRTEGRKHFYALTDEGRNIAALLLEGIEARQVAFFNKYLK
jgi:hypothetical protein